MGTERGCCWMVPSKGAAGWDRARALLDGIEQRALLDGTERGRCGMVTSKEMRRLLHGA